jgi:hypothetical protein
VPKQTWAERFLNSLASEREEDDSRLRDIVQWGDSPRTEDDNLFLAGWNTLAHEKEGTEKEQGQRFTL